MNDLHQQAKAELPESVSCLGMTLSLFKNSNGDVVYKSEDWPDLHIHCWSDLDSWLFGTTVQVFNQQFAIYEKSLSKLIEDLEGKIAMHLAWHDRLRGWYDRQGRKLIEPQPKGPVAKASNYEAFNDPVTGEILHRWVGQSEKSSS